MSVGWPEARIDFKEIASWYFMAMVLIFSPPAARRTLTPRWEASNICVQQAWKPTACLLSACDALRWKKTRELGLPPQGRRWGTFSLFWASATRAVVECWISVTASIIIAMETCQCLSQSITSYLKEVPFSLMICLILAKYAGSYDISWLTNTKSIFMITRTRYWKFSQFPSS